MLYPILRVSLSFLLAFYSEPFEITNDPSLTPYDLIYFVFRTILAIEINIDYLLLKAQKPGARVRMTTSPKFIILMLVWCPMSEVPTFRQLKLKDYLA
jgi:hypothetical protein